MKIAIDEAKGTYTITGEIDKTHPVSKSGNSILLDSSRGTAVTETKYKGQQVRLNVNVTVPNTTKAAA